MSLLSVAHGWSARVGMLWRASLPSQCAVCMAWPAQPICAACRGRFAVVVPRCRTCALRVPAGVVQCGACVRQPPPQNLCLAACDYAWPWTDCIARFKFQSEAGWAAPLAELMAAVPGAAQALSEAEIVLPIPLSVGRLRLRGFNQSLALARRLAPERCEAQLLLRVRDTPAQSGLSRAQRLRNLRGAFVVAAGQQSRLVGRRVLLVDDVMTTGASLGAAAQVLVAAGVTQISTLVLARTA